MTRRITDPGRLHEKHSARIASLTHHATSLVLEIAKEAVRRNHGDPWARRDADRNITDYANLLEQELAMVDESACVVESLDEATK